MLVYGDPSFRSSLPELVRRLAARCDATNPNDLDALRALLIQAGQLEQAAADLFAHSGVPGDALPFQLATDLAATAFYSSYAEDERTLPSLKGDRGAWLAQLRDILEKLSRQSDVLVTVKIPEGFEFYALFPEQYCVAAVEWCRCHDAARQQNAFVVGILSIGTGLSAVVQATLRAAGFCVRRQSVRPTGPCFARTAELMDRIKAEHVLIVDEGPGVSGSSMAAVAAAVCEQGVDPARISFFPGHLGSPGPEASASVRQWWDCTPRFCVPLAKLRWNGKSIEDLLGDRSGGISGHNDPCTVNRAGAGEWRKFAYHETAEWPPVCANFEREKFLCRTEAREAVLWKFTGLGSFLDEDHSSLECPAACSTFAPRPLGTFRGFVALPWIRGRRLTQTDATRPQLFEYAVRHIVEAARPALDISAHREATERLAEMIRRNTEGMLGTNTDRTSKRSAPNLNVLELLPTFGDGRMVPHGWIEAKGGRLFKTNGRGQRPDHTLIGKQSVLWDIAGASVEWNLEGYELNLFLEKFAGKGITVHWTHLTFFRIAYAAFRMGQMFWARSTGDDMEENARLDTAFGKYREQLARWIGE